MKIKMKLILILGMLALMFNCLGQQKSAWANWEKLIGEWKGEGNGKPGKGAGVFSFKADLDNHILMRKSHSEYISDGSKQTIIHDDLMIIYLDFNQIASKAIYFDNEGHTINYTISYSDSSIVLLSEKIENVPIFRLTYTLLDINTVNAKFEISQDGTKFISYIEGKSIKIKQ
jgi:hypothetical protein